MKERKVKIKKGIKFVANTFYTEAHELQQYPTEETELEKIDWTERFYNELDTMLERGELINMNIGGNPGSSKSINACAIAQRLTKKHFKRNFGIKDIDRDQQEYSKTMRNKKIQNTIRVIDEWNELEEAGENSTVEEKLLNYFSDVMAQRNVHKISCSPTIVGDKNAQIYLETIPGSINKETGINTMKLYYKLFSHGGSIIQLLGHVNIDVKPILNSKWYQEYRRRKFEKMDLLLEEGVFQPRKLDYIEATLKTLERVKKLTKLKGVLTHNTIRSYVKITATHLGLPYSVVGEELATKDVRGITDLYETYHTLSKEINKNDERYKTMLIKAKSEDQLRKAKITKETADETVKMRDEILEAIKLQEQELERLMEIKEKYGTIQE